MTKKLKLMPAVSLCVCFLMCIVSLFIQDIPENISYVYQNKKIILHSWHDYFEMFTGLIFLLVLISSLVSTAIWIILKIKSGEKITKKIFLTWVSVILCYIMLGLSDIIINGLWQESDYCPVCYEFTDGQHKIVIEEESFLLYGGGTIYQIDDNNNAFVIGRIDTDDGGRNNGKYDIKWADDGCEITYDYCNLNNDKVIKKVNFK
ncbi:MAG: hypothetical protein K2O29_10245 [Ruminococcus sp.]|nr:hypothetical protein [Ruminococcus sp.]MDE7138815.1 hypothetical protein [Ruminococcus sp.]